jgi:hypothetical protein
MAESMILLGIVIAMRIAQQVVAGRVAVARERVRCHGLATMLGAVEPGALVVSSRADGETLIICPPTAEAV